MLTPLQAYQTALDNDEIQIDAAQKNAVEELERVFLELVKKHEARNSDKSFFSKVSTFFAKSQNDTVQGLYFWGGVGRGKTFLVDLFYDCIPFDQKIRMHFHRFMHMVHDKLKPLKDVTNPLEIVAADIAGDAKVICFDEFHVADITDAMLLANLLKGLFERGVTLVTTSNQMPDDLYSGGLQRDRFLPAIALLKQYTKVVNVDSGVDYRLQFLDKAEIYHYPLDDKANDMLQTNFEHIAPDAIHENEVLEIEGREIRTVRIADGVVWFDFTALCDGPRGAADYIEMARLFQTILLANVPVMDDFVVDQVKRFMTAVDEFYDRNVKLIITAEAKAEEIYVGKRLAEPFKRIISRLNEMSSHDYLAKQHLP